MHTLIVGLGNPGAKYQENRHNIGFLYINYLAKRLQNGEPPSFEMNKTGNTLIYIHADANGNKLILAKPLTYMNRSGASIQHIAQFYKIRPNDITVVHDDLDISLGSFKIQLKTGPKRHNGLLSIEEKIGTNEFWRVRIGVENRSADTCIPGEEYVLQNFTNEEKEKFPSLHEEITKKLEIMNLLIR